MIQRWKRIAAKDTTSYPTFSQFTLFVTKEADIQCNPVVNYSRIGDNQKTNFMKNDKNSPRGQSFITETVPPDNKSEPCQYCKKPRHVLLNCRSFMSKTSDERREFIIKNGICFGCLRIGYKALICPNRLTCSKCDGRHPTCLCGDFNDWKRKKARTLEVPTCMEHAIDTTSAEESVIMKTNTNRESDLTTMIVPVFVSSDDSAEHILVYALQDSQSDSTLILDIVADKLSTSSEAIDLR